MIDNGRTVKILEMQKVIDDTIHRSEQKTETLLLCTVNMMCIVTVIGKSHKQDKGSWSTSGICSCEADINDYAG